MDTRELKNSVKTAASHLADHGFDVPHTRLLEALSRALGERNWATLRARLDAPELHPESGRSADELWLETGKLRAQLADIKAEAKVPEWDRSQGRMTEAQFVLYGGNRCPFCGSTEVESDDVEADGPDVCDESHCNDCGSEWSTAYKVCGYSSAVPGVAALEPTQALAETPVFGRDEVLAFIYLNGASLRWKGYAYSANEAMPHLRALLPETQPGSKEALVQLLNERESDCVEALIDANVLPVMSTEYAAAAKAYSEIRGSAHRAGYTPLHVFRENVVSELVADVQERCKTYEWSTSTLTSCYDAAVDSSQVYNLDATTAELVEAAQRLS